MPFPGVSFGNVLSLSALRAVLAPLERGRSEQRHAACNGLCCVLHDCRSVVLEQEVELAEPGQPQAGAFGDVAVAPAVDLCTRETGNIAPEAVPDAVAGGHPRDVTAGERAPDRPACGEGALAVRPRARGL